MKKSLSILTLIILNCYLGLSQKDSSRFNLELSGGVGFYNFKNTVPDLTKWILFPNQNAKFNNKSPGLNLTSGLTYKRLGINFNLFILDKFGLDDSNTRYAIRNWSFDFLFYPFNTHWNLSPYLGLGIGSSKFTKSVYSQVSSATRPDQNGYYTVSYSDTWDETTLFKSHYLPIRVGLVIRPFKTWIKGGFFQGFCLKIEKSFFYYNKYGKGLLDGSQNSLSIGCFAPLG